MARGARSCASKGMALGAMGSQPPSSSVICRPPCSQGAKVLALRPACASWMPATAPSFLIPSAMGRQAAACASLHMPVSPGEIRPTALTPVASAMIMPTPPAARLR